MANWVVGQFKNKCAYSSKKWYADSVTIESGTVGKENVAGVVPPVLSPVPVPKEFNDRVMQFRVYLKPEQEKVFSQLYGNQRFFRNKFLAVLEETYGIECDARKPNMVSTAKVCDLKEGDEPEEEITTSSGIPYMGNTKCKNLSQRCKECGRSCGLALSPCYAQQFTTLMRPIRTSSLVGAVNRKW